MLPYRNASVPLFLLSLIIWAVCAQARPLTEQDIPVTRNLLGTPMPTRAEYLAQFPQRELFLHDVYRSQIRRDEEGTVILAVNHQLLSDLEEPFAQFRDDIAEDGYDVVLLDVEGGSPEEIKELVIEEGGDDLVGVIFAGEIALAWFEQYEHFYDENEPDNHILVEYPIDLFFMDLDGTWQDTSRNGKYDLHTGDREPDIWFGRLPAYNLSRIDENELIGSYLERVHDYKTGGLSLPHQALNFIDDDWIIWAEEWEFWVSLSFGMVFTVSNPELTSATNYHRELEHDDGYKLVQVAVHSSAEANIFWINNHQDLDYFRFNHLRDDTEPQAMFYNLFACSNMNLASNLCMGALYALGGPYGLGAVGSSKPGSMLFFEDYYSQLGEGACFGDAFRHWFTLHGQEPDRENWARSWFYGMTYFGDPTLKLLPGLRVHEFTVLDEEGGDDDNIADAGETIDLVLVVENLSQDVIEDVDILLETEDNYLEIVDGESFVEAVDPDEFSTVDGLTLRIAGDCPDLYQADITVRMVTEEEEEWVDLVVLEVRSPELYPVSFTFEEVDGDGDGWTEPGEDGSLYLTFLNDGGDDLRGISSITFQSLDGKFLPGLDSVELPAVETGNTATSQPIDFMISGEAVANNGALVRVTADQDDILRGWGVLLFPLSEELEFGDDFGEEPAWTNSYALNTGYNNIWRWGDDAGHGSGGIAFGEPDSSLYQAHSDGAFELPLMMFEEDVVLRLHHRMSAEEGYDGGIIEVDRGFGWSVVRPVRGYNGHAVSNGSFEGGPCWNGIFDWRDDEVEIGGPPGPLRIRFRFFSDDHTEYEGWFIDAISVNGTPFDVEEDIFAPDAFSFTSVYPNPFNSSLNIEYSLAIPSVINLSIFDYTGRLVEILSEGYRKPGKHLFSYDGTVLPAGVYMLRLQAGPDSETTLKIVLLK